MNDKENDSYQEADEEQPLKASLIQPNQREESKKHIDFDVDDENAQP